LVTKFNNTLKSLRLARHQWLTPIILAIQEAEIRRIGVQHQLGQIVCKTLSQKNPSQQGTCGVTQGEGPEFKPRYHKHTPKSSGSSWFHSTDLGWFNICKLINIIQYINSTRDKKVT
jgi:hypothetical protein